MYDGDLDKPNLRFRSAANQETRRRTHGELCILSIPAGFVRGPVLTGQWLGPVLKPSNWRLCQRACSIEQGLTNQCCRLGRKERLNITISGQTQDKTNVAIDDFNQSRIHLIPRMDPEI
jgi:hypothetical protein